jgi:hypothetical protein
MFGRKKRIKVEFELTISAAQWTFGYTKLAEKSFQVEWKRGEKDGNSGKTKSIVLQDGNDSVHFDEKQKFSATIYYKDLKAGKFEKKLMTFSLLVVRAANESFGIESGVADSLFYVPRRMVPRAKTKLLLEKWILILLLFVTLVNSSPSKSSSL